MVGHHIRAHCAGLAASGKACVFIRRSAFAAGKLLFAWRQPMRRFFLLFFVLMLPLMLLAACRSMSIPTPGTAASETAGEAATATAGPAPGTAPDTLVVATHDSFAVSDAVVQEFEQANNARLQFLTLGDAGAALNKVILSKDAPLADLFFGVDNTFLSRALKADIFEPYAAAGVEAVASDLRLAPNDELTPIDFGFVNINADAAWFADKGIALPTSLEELTKPEYKGLLVAPNPATSSPGLAFLLATIGHFGEDRYLDFWQGLRANDVLITDGWSEAYFEHFTVGSAGQGNRPLVVSYSSSPPADVVYATDGRTKPASVNLDVPGGAFRQVEFAGVLRGAKQPELARRFIDYMLSVPFQEDIPLQMFVYPANPEAKLPDVFTQFAAPPADPVVMDPAAIDANRERWIRAWTDAVLR
jgi:thiamine transport system substrate-binding protein